MTNDDRVMVGARLPEWQKKLLDQDDRPIQEVISVAVEKEYGGQEVADLRRERSELRREIAELESQIEEREIRLGEKRNRLDVVNSRINKAVDEEQAKKAQVLAKFDMIPVEEDGVNHPYVQQAAEELEVTPEKAIEMWEEME